MSARSGAQFVPIGMPTVCWKTFPAKTTKILSTRNSSILKQHDIILLQEHWLYSFEKPYLEQLADSLGWGVVIKCVDDEDPIGPQCRPRGKGGVATMWTKKLDSHINILPDGNQRVLITEVGNQICIINVYMPTRGTGESEMEFDGCLAELEEITAKYGTWTNMIIAGDMNASLHRQKVLRRDQHFQNFVTRCGYKLANNYPESPTFEHHNGSKSQIDYILAIVPQKIIKVEISKREPLNTSTHNSISATILADLQTASSTTEGKAVGKIKWDKIDKDDYSERVTRKLQNIPNDKQKDSKTLLQEISTVLTQAAEEIQPKTSVSNKRKRKLISPSAMAACSLSKEIHWRIKN